MGGVMGLLLVGSLINADIGVLLSQNLKYRAQEEEVFTSYKLPEGS